MRPPFLAVRSRSADETTSLGRRIAALLRPGDVLLLVGDLGTGKTTFVQGLALGLGIGERPHSPTFALVHRYDGGTLPLVHVDLYRTDSSTEVVDLGLEELFEPPSVAAVEWGEKAAGVVGPDHLELSFAWDDGDEDTRTIRLVPIGSWQDRMTELSEAVRSWAEAS